MMSAAIDNVPTVSKILIAGEDHIHSRRSLGEDHIHSRQSLALSLKFLTHRYLHTQLKFLYQKDN